MADPRKSASMVQIKKLHLPFPVSTMSAWGQLKEQPAFVTVSIEFRDEFASGKDDLSGSIHYGELSKRIRALVPILASGFWPGDLSEAIENVVFEMGSEQVRQARGPVLCNYSKHHAALKDFRLGQISKTSANASTYHPQHPEGQREQNPILNVVSELHFPKASMTGDEIVITRTKKVELNSYGEAVPSIERPIFSIPNMRLMTIIGMNPHERKARQPVVASLTVEYTHVSLEDSDSEGTEVCFKEIDAVFVERVVVKLIEESEYETLELMAKDTIDAVVSWFREREYATPAVCLRLEKPKAIVFAEAAVVELYVPAPVVQPPRVKKSIEDVEFVKIERPVKAPDY